MGLTNQEKRERAEKRRKEKYNKEHKNIDGVVYKWCKLGEHWEVMNKDHFYINKSNSTDGFHPSCKYHSIKDTQNWRKENPEWYKELNHKNNTNPSEKTRKTYRRNAKNRRDNGKYYEWLRNNPNLQQEYLDLRQHKNHTITKKEWIACKQYFNNCCAYCGLSLEEHWITYRGKVILGDFHKEHVRHKGSNDLSNCVPSCKTCNSEKHDFDLDVWYNDKNIKFTEERYMRIMQWLNQDYKKFIIINKQYIS